MKENLQIFILVAKGPYRSFSRSGQMISKTCYSSYELAQSDVEAFKNACEEDRGGFNEIENVKVSIVELELKEK